MIDPRCNADNALHHYDCGFLDYFITIGNLFRVVYSLVYKLIIPNCDLTEST
jgi:hypothetical protein